MATTSNRLAGKTVTLSAGRKVTSKQIDVILKDIYKLSGCLTCGLLGFDIRILGGDPDPLFGDVEGFNVNVR